MESCVPIISTRLVKSMGWHKRMLRADADDAPTAADENDDGIAVRNNAQVQKQRYVTQAEWYHYRLFPRVGESPHLFMGKASSGIYCGCMGNHRAEPSYIYQAQPGQASCLSPSGNCRCHFCWSYCWHSRPWPADYIAIFFFWKYTEYDSKLSGCTCHQPLLPWSWSFSHCHC